MGKTDPVAVTRTPESEILRTLQGRWDVGVDGQWT